MRLTEDQVKQGILHADQDVRFSCLHYFSECFSANSTVMPVAIEALERFGRTRAFRFAHPISALAQTEETIRWVIGELASQPRKTEEERDYLDQLSRLLSHAEPTLIQPHEKEILSSPGFDRDCAETLKRRLRLMSWNGDALWRELEAICEEGKGKDCSGDMRWDEGVEIVEDLAREGSRHADRMMSLLAIKIENYENNPMTWMEPLMIRLAGDLHHEPAIPLIVGKLHDDAEVVSEECVTALTKIGADAAVQAIREAYPTAKWHFRLYASAALGQIHTDPAVQACIDLLEKEEDLDIENWLAQSLVGQFSYEGNEAARKVLLSDPDLYDLQRMLVRACTLMEQNFPELDEWRKEIEEKTRAKQLARDAWRAPTSTKPLAASSNPPRPSPITVDKRIGRNDPCPCGSGKKFKKCCLNKPSIF